MNVSSMCFSAVASRPANARVKICWVSARSVKSDKCRRKSSWNTCVVWALYKYPPSFASMTDGKLMIQAGLAVWHVLYLSLGEQENLWGDLGGIGMN